MSLEEVKKEKHALMINPDQQDLLRKTYAKKLTSDEFQLFLQVAHSTGLNPFLKEIIPTKFISKKTGEETLTFITTRDGYLKIAQIQYDVEYEGLISFAVHENDTFEIDAANYTVKHIFAVGGRGRGKIIGAWAKCDRKGRKPQICFVPFDEYYSDYNDIWKKYPSAMIIKVAESFVLKRQFVINGLVTREEMGMQETEIDTYIPEPIQQPISKPTIRPKIETKPEAPLETVVIKVPQRTVEKPADVKPEPMSIEEAQTILPPKPTFNRKKKSTSKAEVVQATADDVGVPDDFEKIWYDEAQKLDQMEEER
jgi:phage recombination protein Bet